MKIKAYAKINISLDVVGKREDGYHLLEMIMQTIDLYDIVEVKKVKNGIQLECDKYYVPTDERNIAYKAAMIFKEHFGIDEGIIEQITQLKPFKDKILVLIKPPFGVSTKNVYKEFDLSKVILHPKTKELIKNMEEDNLEFVANNMKNLLENVTLRRHKTIANIKEGARMKECLGTMMSGSGPTVFAFFDDMYKAQLCYDYMKDKYKDVFITRTI